MNKARSLVPAQKEMSKERKYELEKTLGRRDESGRWNLKKLKSRHKLMIAAVVQGKSQLEVAEEFGVSKFTVERVLRDPLAQEYLQVLYGSLESELKGLAFLSIEAVRQSLRYGSSEKIKLAAVDRMEKLYKIFDPELKKSGSGVNVQINNINESAEGQSQIDIFLERLEKMAQEKSFNIKEEAQVVEADIIQKPEED